MEFTKIGIITERKIECKKLLLATPLIKKLLLLGLSKSVAFLQTSDFPLENPRSQNRNFP